ncbi:myozenin-3 [Fukomys damarensis]|uniref:myozenin-3 n=1 Tax=Fukomys damarensis TaxID=885580 RepID=UPI0014550F60|nr:myozenin-3 [Fukomys damarensis]
MMDPKEQQDAVIGDFTGPEPSLDLGKKVSVPQDLMIEELSLRNNRGSLLFQKRQRRVQRFTFELAASQQASPSAFHCSPQTLAGSTKGKGPEASEPGPVANGPEGPNYGSELRDFSASPGVPEGARPAAPGYAEPLKSVPPEKFNHTAVPKGYRCPWQEFVSGRDYWSEGRSHTPSLGHCRNFNKIPVPFGGVLVGEAISRAAAPFVPEPFDGLELLRLRPCFNRMAQGWVRNLPESDEL